MMGRVSGMGEETIVITNKMSLWRRDHMEWKFIPCKEVKKISYCKLILLATYEISSKDSQREKYDCRNRQSTPGHQELIY